MKSVGKVAGLAFGFSAVNAGQRNASSEPQVIAVSTEGNFRLTAAASKVLGLGHGDNIMFISNVDGIDQAIANKQEELVAWVEEAGLAWGSPEALVAIHKEFDSWMIAKGIAELDGKGFPKMATERLTKEDRAKFISQDYDGFLAQVLAADESDVSEEIKDALQRDGITKEESIAILSQFVQAREVPKIKGSKLANPGGLTGSGVPLTFTDSNVWKQLKVDLKDQASKVNRLFDLDIEDIQTTEINNGFEMVEVKGLVLGTSTDKEPARIGTKEAAEEAEEA